MYSVQEHFVSHSFKSRVLDQIGVSQTWCIVEIHHSGWKPSIWSLCWEEEECLPISGEYCALDPCCLLHHFGGFAHYLLLLQQPPFVYTIMALGDPCALVLEDCSALVISMKLSIASLCNFFVRQSWLKEICISWCLRALSVIRNDLFRRGNCLMLGTFLKFGHQFFLSKIQISHGYPPPLKNDFQTVFFFVFFLILRNAHASSQLLLEFRLLANFSMSVRYMVHRFPSKDFQTFFY